MQRKTIIHPFISAMVNQVESWLSDMSLNGWILEEQKGWKFTFVKSASKKREYFMYSAVDLSKGFWADYHMAEKRYKLNQSKLMSSCSMFEVDSNKIDAQYSQYKSIRNNYYKKHYLKLFLSTFICIVILSTISIATDRNLFGEIIIFLLLFIYFTVSYIIVKYTSYR